MILVQTRAAKGTLDTLPNHNRKRRAGELHGTEANSLFAAESSDQSRPAAIHRVAESCFRNGLGLRRQNHECDTPRLSLDAWLIVQKWMYQTSRTVK